MRIMHRDFDTAKLLRRGFALLGLIAIPATCQAELVLRLDASDLSTLSLSTDMTDGDIFGFPDVRQTGLKFVEQWGQKYGATANPALNKKLTPVGSPVLTRPTYDPNGLGPGKASVNFDYIQGDVVLGSGQRLAAGLDNFVDSADFTIFFVGNWKQELVDGEPNNRFQFAFGQDLDFRTGGWGMSVQSGEWEGRIGGYAADPDVLGVARAEAGTTIVPGVQSFIGTAAGTVDFESRVGDGTIVVDSEPRLEHGLWGGADFAVGDRGGKDPGVSRPFNGRISEIAIFNTELSSTERTAVRAFLENKWVGGPAPTAQQLSLATSLLQQPAPTNIQNIARYEFYKETSTDPDTTIVTPDWVAPGVTASDFGSGGGFQTENDGSFGVSGVGISQRSVYLGSAWSSNATEQSPTNESPYYLEFSVTPTAGKEIDPAELSFALARGEDVAQAHNGSDSYGVWIDRGAGFTKVGGQVSLGDPPASDELVPFFFQTVNVDLSSVSPFTSQTKIRVYIWHEGELVNPDPVVQYSARLDNLRLLGVVQDVGAGGVVGDYNDDGIVNAADYAVWRDNLGSTKVLPNDSTPGTVTAADYNVWKANFGMSGGSGSAAGASVPEPSALCALSIAAAVISVARGLSSRRRQFGLW